MNAQQIKQMKLKVIDIYNKKVSIITEQFEKAKEVQKKKYKTFLVDALEMTSLDRAQRKAAIEILYKNGQDAWSEEKETAIHMNKLFPINQKEHSTYELKGYMSERHPLHKIIKDLEFELIMEDVSNVQKFLESFEKRIEELF